MEIQKSIRYSRMSNISEGDRGKPEKQRENRKERERATDGVVRTTAGGNGAGNFSRSERERKRVLLSFTKYLLRSKQVGSFKFKKNIQSFCFV